MPRFVKHIFISLFCFVFTLSSAALLAHAQSAQSKSNCVFTNIGNPQGAPQDIPQNCSDAGGSNNDVVKAAQALTDAFQKCVGGITHPGGEACISASLKSNGYSQAQIEAMNARRGPASNTSTNCAQCLGYVGMILALIHTDPGALVGIGSAQNVNSISVKGATYTRVAQPQPGDIGVTESGANGHIFIVKSVSGSLKITAIESNWLHDCRATDNISHPKTGYIFFRSK